MEMKKCCRCKKKKYISYFNYRSGRKGKLKSRRSYCKKCANEYSIKWRKEHPEKSYQWDRNKRLKKHYGITESQYVEMLKFQHNRCAICNAKASDFKYRLAVDHSHVNGAVRGLLCVRCNTGIGNLKNKKLLIKAIEYISTKGE